MKTFIALIIAAFTLAACNENPEPIDIPEPTSYNVKFVMECDSCEGVVGTGVEQIFPVVGSFEFDTVLQGNGQIINSSCIDFEPDNSIYNTEIYVDGVLVADSLIMGDTSKTYQSVFCYFILN